MVAVIAAGAGVAVVLAGDDDDTDGGAGADLATEDLEPALLTEEDVGGRYALAPDDEDDGSSDTDDFGLSDECRELLEALEEGGDTSDEVGVEFVDDADASVSNTLGLLLPGEPALDDVRSALDQCGTMTFEEAGATGEVQITTEEVGGLGEAALAVDIVLLIDAEGISMTLESHGLLWEHDGVAADVVAFAGVDETTLEPTPVDEAWVRELAETVDRRLDEIATG